MMIKIKRHEGRG